MPGMPPHRIFGPHRAHRTAGRRRSVPRRGAAKEADTPIAGDRRRARHANHVAKRSEARRHGTNDCRRDHAGRLLGSVIMTNDECLMTKEARMSNPEIVPFVILALKFLRVSSLVIRHSS